MENQLRELILPLSEALIKQLSESMARQDKQQINFYWIELVVWMLLTAFALKLMLGLVKLLFGRGYEGSRIPCPACGQKMKFQRYRPRPILSSFGPLSLDRAYYYCGYCHSGSAPLDDRLELARGELSPRLQRVMAFQSAHLSFGVVKQSLKESYELEISDEAIRLISEQIGQQARNWEDQQALCYSEKPLPSQQPTQPPRTWILEIDGKKVGLQDGSWNEVKVAVLYELSDRVEPHTGRHELLQRELVARRSSWREFVPHCWAAMHRAGLREGDRLVAVADAAEGIESIFDLVAPEATRIRDFYHVAERIHAIGELRFGPESQKGKDWIGLQLDKLKESDVTGVVRAIAHLRFDTEAEEAKRDQVLSYLQKNRQAMDYGQYRAEGLPMGSGAVEGGCKLIGVRTNGCGRRWGVTGCDQIVALRVAVLNERLDVILPKPKIEKLAA